MTARIAALASTAGASLLLCSCGSGASRVAVRVGGAPIGVATVEHWAKAIASGAIVGGPERGAAETPRQQALAFLISSRWLLGQAQQLGLHVGAGAIESRLAELEQAVPGGSKGYRESLEGVGQNKADAELEVKTELAESMLRRRLASTPAPVSQAQIAARYHATLKRFRVPERRRVEIINEIGSAAAARRLARKVGSGRRFTAIALTETRERPGKFGGPHNKRAVEMVIFSSRPNVLRGPMRLIRGYSLFVVREIMPATVQPLSAVSGKISSELVAEQRRASSQAFVSGYRQKWVSQTDCRSGFVVPGCRQYAGRGPRAPDPLGA